MGYSLKCIRIHSCIKSLSNSELTICSVSKIINRVRNLILNKFRLYYIIYLTISFFYFYFNLNYLSGYI